jgi:hypothetical protein
MSLSAKVELLEEPAVEKVREFQVRVTVDLTGASNEGSTSENNQQEKEIFTASCEMTGDFATKEDKEISIAELRHSLPIFAAQIYPAIRMFLADLLSKMGIHADPPWSLPPRRNPQRKKSGS